MKIGSHTAKNGQSKICEPTYLTLEWAPVADSKIKTDKNKRRKERDSEAEVYLKPVDRTPFHMSSCKAKGVNSREQGNSSTSWRENPTFLNFQQIKETKNIVLSGHRTERKFQDCCEPSLPPTLLLRRSPNSWQQVNGD